MGYSSEAPEPLFHEPTSLWFLRLPTEMVLVRQATTPWKRSCTEQSGLRSPVCYAHPITRRSVSSLQPLGALSCRWRSTGREREKMQPPPHTHPRNWLVFCHARDTGCFFFFFFFFLTLWWMLGRTDSRLWNSVHKQRNLAFLPQGVMMGVVTQQPFHRDW